MKLNQLPIFFGAALLFAVAALAWGLTRGEQRAEVKTILEACAALASGNESKLIGGIGVIGNTLIFADGVRIRLVGIAAKKASCAVMPNGAGGPETAVRVRVGAVDTARIVAQIRAAPPYPDLRDLTPTLEAVLSNAINLGTAPRLETTVMVELKKQPATGLTPAGAKALLLAVTGNMPTALGWPLP